jgi:hypothetical protein
MSGVRPVREISPNQTRGARLTPAPTRKPVELKQFFTLTRKGAGPARCALWSHRFGLEVRLFYIATGGDLLIRSRLCRTKGDVPALVDALRSDMVRRGWA